MHRLKVEKELLFEHSPVLERDALQHLKVVRPKAGELVELFDGAGATRGYQVTPSGRDFVLEAAGERVETPRPPIALTLFACVTKGARWDWTLEKATELGVTRIVPVLYERTIVKVAPGERADKSARWKKIVEEAARQSDAVWLPELLEPQDFVSALRLASATDCYIGALTEPPSPMLAAALAERRGENAAAEVSVFVGPEGDFTPAELAALMKVATPTSFGSTILRAETAAVFALSVVKGCLDAK